MLLNAKDQGVNFRNLKLLLAKTRVPCDWKNHFTSYNFHSLPQKKNNDTSSTATQIQRMPEAKFIQFCQMYVETLISELCFDI